jgi:hypothetical protein
MGRVVEIPAVVVIGSLLAVGPAAAGAGAAKYAGTVRAIDSARGSLVLDDVGPWVGKTESPITPRTVSVSPSTEYLIADRAKDGATGYPGDYVETKAQLSDVKVGAFVAVECQRDGGRCAAVKLVVVRPSQP